LSEESTSPDLIELGREAFEALNRGDLDAVMNLYAPDAVWVATALGENFEGVAAIRGLYEEFTKAVDDYALEIDEMLDLGNGVGFAVVCHQGHPFGGTGYVHQREAIVTLWVDGLLAWGAGHLDIDEGRAAAERLAQERG